MLNSILVLELLSGQESLLGDCLVVGVDATVVPLLELFVEDLSVNPRTVDIKFCLSACLLALDLIDAFNELLVEVLILLDGRCGCGLTRLHILGNCLRRLDGCELRHFDGLIVSDLEV